MRIVIVTAVSSLMLGCAATRSTIDVAMAKPTTTVAGTPKVYATIVRVTDARLFEAAPSSPAVPSLENADDLQNPAIKARAVARKRGGFGKAMADILLPEGRTVAQLVREAAVKAMSDKGYGVVDAASATQMNARPVELEIKQYWAWFTPGFFAIKLEFEGIVIMKGDVLASGNEQSVRGYTLVESLAATDGEWQRTMQLGASDLIEKMKAVLREP